MNWIEDWKAKHAGQHPFYNEETDESNANQVLYEEMLIGNYKAVNFAESIDMEGSTANYLTQQMLADLVAGDYTISETLMFEDDDFESPYLNKIAEAIRQRIENEDNVEELQALVGANELKKFGKKIKVGKIKSGIKKLSKNKKVKDFTKKYGKAAGKKIAAKAKKAAAKSFFEQDQVDLPAIISLAAASTAESSEPASSEPAKEEPAGEEGFPVWGWALVGAGLVGGVAGAVWFSKKKSVQNEEGFTQA